MDRRILAGVTLSLALLLATLGVLHSQEAPVAPEPPAPPDPPQALFGESPARLGVQLRDVTAEKARELKLPGEYGAIVEQVEPRSPAAKAGLAKGDVVLEFAGERVRSTTQLRRLVRETPAERTVNIRVSRAGKTLDFNVKLEPAQDQFRFSYRAPMVHPEIHIPRVEVPEFQFDFFPGGAVLGVSADDLTSQLATYFNVKQGKGAFVREVEAGSAAEKAGLKAGDVIVGIDGKPVGSVSDLRRALPRDFEGKKPVTLAIVRDRQEQKVTVELEAPRSMMPLHEVEEEVNAISPAELQRLAAEVQAHQAEIQKSAAEAARQWTAEKRRSMEEVRRSMELLKQQMKELELQRLREQAHPGDVI